MPALVVEADPAGFRYAAVNPACARAAGIEAAAILGRSPGEVFVPATAAAIERDYRLALDAAGPLCVETTGVLPAGLMLWRMILRPLVEPATGRVHRILAIAIEVGGELRSAASLRQEQAAKLRAARLDAVLDAMSELIVRFAPDGTIFYCNDAFAQAHDRPRAAMIGASLGGCLEPAERAFVRIRLARLTPAAPGTRTVLPIARHGQLRHEEWIDRAIFDAAGRALEFQSVGRDITDRVRAEERLRQSEERYRVLVQTSPDAVFIVQDQRLVFVNPAGAHLLRAPDPAAVLGRPAADFIHPGQREALAARLKEIDAGGRPVPLCEWLVQRLDGTCVPVEAVSGRVTWEGRPASQITSRDISERKAAQRMIEHLALHDHLTGLANRALFHRELEQACARARRSGACVALFLLDLDGFKQINDTLGHGAGDDLLVQVAQRLKSNLRDTDVVSRIGGDEFAVIAADQLAAADLVHVIERIERLFVPRFALREQAVTVGASVGVALYPDDSRELDQLIACADKAMYAAKRVSRRRLQPRGAMTMTWQATRREVRAAGRAG